MLNKIKLWKNGKQSSNLRERLIQIKGNLFLHMSQLLWMVMEDGPRKRALPRIAGHHEGMKVVRKNYQSSQADGYRGINLICIFN